MIHNTVLAVRTIDMNSASISLRVIQQIRS